MLVSKATMNKNTLTSNFYHNPNRFHFSLTYLHTSVATDLDLRDKSTKFCQFVLRKITKIAATICQILRLKCTKFNFGWGSAPDRARGAYSAPPNSLVGFGGRFAAGGGAGLGRGGNEGGEDGDRKSVV